MECTTSYKKLLPTGGMFSTNFYSIINLYLQCATEVFGGKKTYQALKGCYERNFNLFKQIYAFETAHGQAGGNSNLAGLSEADRLREYERRLQIARKAGSDVGNITARTIDHWHRVGWYDLFYRRYVMSILVLSFFSD